MKCRLFELSPPSIKYFLQKEVKHLPKTDIKIRKVIVCFAIYQFPSIFELYAPKLDKLEYNEVLDIGYIFIEDGVVGTIANIFGICHLKNNKMRITRSELFLDEFRMLSKHRAEELVYIELLHNKLFDTRSNPPVELSQAQVLECYLEMAKNCGMAYLTLYEVPENWEKILYDKNELKMRKLGIRFDLCSRNLFTNLKYLHGFMQRQTGLTLEIDTKNNIEIQNELLEYFEEADDVHYRMQICTDYCKNSFYFNLKKDQ